MLKYVSRTDNDYTSRIISDNAKKDYWREIRWLILWAIIGLYITVMLYFYQGSKMNFVVPLLAKLKEPETPQYDVLVTRVTLVSFIIFIPTVYKLWRNIFGVGKL